MDSSGNGTILHLAAEMFKDVTGTFVTHIPYPGVAPMVSDIIAGEVDMGVLLLPSAQSTLAFTRPAFSFGSVILNCWVVRMMGGIWASMME